MSSDVSKIPRNIFYRQYVHFNCLIHYGMQWPMVCRPLHTTALLYFILAMMSSNSAFVNRVGL